MWGSSARRATHKIPAQDPILPLVARDSKITLDVHTHTHTHWHASRHSTVGSFSWHRPHATGRGAGGVCHLPTGAATRLTYARATHVSPLRSLQSAVRGSLTASQPRRRRTLGRSRRPPPPPRHSHQRWRAPTRPVARSPWDAIRTQLSSASPRSPHPPLWAMERATERAVERRRCGRLRPRACALARRRRPGGGRWRSCARGGIRIGACRGDRQRIAAARATWRARADEARGYVRRWRGEARREEAPQNGVAARVGDVEGVGGEGGRGLA